VLNRRDPVLESRRPARGRRDVARALLGLPARNRPHALAVGRPLPLLAAPPTAAVGRLPVRALAGAGAAVLGRMAVVRASRLTPSAAAAAVTRRSSRRMVSTRAPRVVEMVCLLLAKVAAAIALGACPRRRPWSAGVAEMEARVRERLEADDVDDRRAVVVDDRAEVVEARMTVTMVALAYARPEAAGGRRALAATSAEMGRSGRVRALLGPGAAAAADGTAAARPAAAAGARRARGLGDVSGKGLVDVVREEGRIDRASGRVAAHPRRRE